MSTRISGRSVAACNVDRSAVKNNKDRSSLRTFTFADGRRCRTPRCSGSSYCFFHARKEAQARAADQLGRDISFFLSSDYVSACYLSTALGRVFAAAAQGHIIPRTASRLAYRGQVLVQTMHLARDEYINAFGTEGWRNAVRRSVDSNSDYLHGLANEDSSQPPLLARHLHRSRPHARKPSRPPKPPLHLRDCIPRLPPSLLPNQTLFPRLPCT